MCLEFANTLAYRGSTPTESLHTFADLIKWCGDAGVTPLRISCNTCADGQRNIRSESPRYSARRLRLREVDLPYFSRARLRVQSCRGRPGSSQSRASATRRCVRSWFSRGPTGFGWQVEESKPSASWILAPVLWSAGDLLVGPQLTRLRECSNEKCLWLFLDDSKNGTRRWCSMQACGNRAKAHRHYLRQKGA